MVVRQHAPRQRRPRPRLLRALNPPVNPQTLVPRQGKQLLRQRSQPLPVPHPQPGPNAQHAAATVRARVHRSPMAGAHLARKRRPVPARVRRASGLGQVEAKPHLARAQPPAGRRAAPVRAALAGARPLHARVRPLHARGLPPGGARAHLTRARTSEGANIVPGSLESRARRQPIPHGQAMAPER